MNASLLKNMIARADVLVHIGAGKCRELESYKTLRSGKRTVLVEAHPALASALAARTNALEGVSVIEAAVAGDSEPRKLHVYNLPDRNSLQPASKLQALYPGLRLLEEIPVKTRGVVSLLEVIDLGEKESVLLVVDAPGAETEVIQALASSAIAARCKHILLHCSRQALYENSADATELTKCLEMHGYEHRFAQEAEDPEFRVIGAYRNGWKIECARLRAELDRSRQAQTSKIEELEAERDRLAEDLRTIKADVNAKASKFQKDRDQAQEEKTALVKSLEKSKSELVSVRSQFAQEITKLRAERQSLQSEHQKFIEEATVAESRLAEIQKEREELRNCYEKAQAERDSLSEVFNTKAREAEQLVNSLRDELKQEKQRLVTTEKERNELRAELDRQKKQYQEQSGRLRKFESENSDLAHRQKLLDAEVARAEGQINLLRDVLLIEREV